MRACSGTYLGRYLGMLARQTGPAGPGGAGSGALEVGGPLRTRFYGPPPAEVCSIKVHGYPGT